MSDPPGRDDRRPPRAEVGTRLLRAREQGEPGSEEKLFLLVYDELREIAGAFLRRERPDHTLQPTALVHEAWMRLVDAESVGWQGRAHFFGTAARAMRRILVEHARGKERLKRGGAWRRVDLDPDLMQGGEEVDLDALDRALEKLAALSERPARVVELRFFSGLPVETVAEVLGVSARTVEREWRFARAWLAEALGEPGG
ncbi:MAG: sigma-70 family RNA polymerase sigma factor [Planctomycetota bacterium]